MAWKPDYITTSQLKSFLRIGDITDDVELAFAITAASRAVDKHCNRQFGQVDEAEEREYTPYWDRRRRRWIIEIDDLQDTDDLTVTREDEEVITDITLEPVNAVKKGKVFTHIVVNSGSPVTPTHGKNLTIEALWGWEQVPDSIKQATLLQASRFHSRRFSPFGVAGSPDEGSEVRLLNKVDPDVAVSLSPFIRWYV